jgi:hypothetical protein
MAGVVQLAIPHSAIRSYASASRLWRSPDRFGLFLRCIRAMDRVWLDHARKWEKRLASGDLDDAMPAADEIDGLPQMTAGAFAALGLGKGRKNV